MIFNYSNEELKEIKGEFTLSEINHQPDVWKDVIEIIKNKKTEIEQFIKKELNNQTRVIFSGAGTSEFVGNSIAPYFVSKGIDAISIASTDLVSNIEEYVDPNKKTILISFARSGNSPESVGTFNMMNDFVKDIKHIIITCNKNGMLALDSQKKEGNLVLILPEKSNDKSFAMTSSYTGMIITAYLVLNIFEFDLHSEYVINLISNVKNNMNKQFKEIQKLANKKHSRVVYLGSGNLNGIAQESHLKLLELSAGEVCTFFNTPLGFRHGPKSILNKETLLVMYLNQNPYKRKYDMDLLQELYKQKQLESIVVIDFKDDKEVKLISDNYLVFENSPSNNLLLGVNYVTFAQIYAFCKSVFLGKTPDNPWPSGLVNRVVQGVVIHKK